jgi:hypothetical protein
MNEGVTMPHRFQKPMPEHLREPLDVNVPGLWHAYFLAIAIAIGLGVVGGSLWIAWRLLIAPWFD